jgi:hypothetical protein
MAYTQITRAGLRTLVQQRLGAIGTVFYRDAELNLYIQEALRFFNALTGFWRGRLLITTVANRVWNPLSSSLTSGMRVSFNDHPLSPTTLRDLDLGRRNWEGETTASGSDVPTEPKMWAPAGLQLIAIWPADAVGNNTLLCDGVSATPILTMDSQKIDIGTEEVESLLNYCEHLAMFKQGGEEFSESQDEFQSVLANAGERNGLLMASSKYRTFMGLDTSRDKKPRKADNPRVGMR